MSDQITLHDCCRLILENWPFRRQGAAEPLRDYHRRLLQLLNSEFAIDWRDETDRDSRDRKLPMILVDMPRSYSRLAGPFHGFLEYMPVPGEMELWRTHRDALAVAETAFKERWVALFRDLLLLRWPGAAGRTTSWSRLKSLGLGDPVEEIDFF